MKNSVVPGVPWGPSIDINSVKIYSLKVTTVILKWSYTGLKANLTESIGKINKEVIYAYRKNCLLKYYVASAESTQSKKARKQKKWEKERKG